MIARHRWLADLVASSIAFSMIQASPALAQGSDDKRVAAKEHYDKGTTAYDDKRFDEALKEFEMAYGLTEDFRVLYEIGIVNKDRARPIEAVDAFEEYLRAGGDKIKADRRKLVGAAIEEQKAKIGSIAVRTVPENAQTFVDGVMVGHTPLEPPTRVAQGRRKLTIALVGYQNEIRELEVAGGSNTILDITLKKVPDVPLDEVHRVKTDGPGRDADVAVTERHLPDQSSSKRPGLTKGMLLAGAVLIAGGGAAWLVAGAKLQSLVDDCSKGCTTSRYTSGANDVRTWDRLAGAGLITGAAVGAGGAILYLASRPGGGTRSSPAVSVAIDPIARMIALGGSLP